MPFPFNWYQIPYQMPDLGPGSLRIGVARLDRHAGAWAAWAQEDVLDLRAVFDVGSASDRR